MPMKNPVHPGALAKANLDELNLSVAEAAKTMKITRQQLHNVMQGRSAVRLRWRCALKRLSAAAPTCGCECKGV
jgi:addiction module HigA family antidote